MLDNNILMFIHPSSGDNIFYKVRDDNNIILIDSFGNEPKKEDQGRRIKLNFPSTAYLSSPHSIPLSVVLG